MSYTTTKRIIVVVYVIGLCFMLSMPLLVQKRDPKVLIPSWERTENQSATRPYDIVNDAYGYKSLAPIIVVGSVFYLFSGAFVLSAKVEDEALSKTDK